MTDAEWRTHERSSLRNTGLSGGLSGRHIVGRHPALQLCVGPSNERCEVLKSGAGLPSVRPALRLSEMKWEKAGAAEYGGLPASAVVGQRACGRVWIGAEPRNAKASWAKGGPEAQHGATEAKIQARRDEPGASRRASRGRAQSVQGRAENSWS